jgi:EcsC protein family
MIRRREHGFLLSCKQRAGWNSGNREVIPAHLTKMPRRPKSTLVSNVFQASIRAGFRRAYHGVQVDPQKFLQQFRRAHRLPIHTWSDMFHVEENLVNHYAARVVKSSMRTAALEGAGLGLGGMLTILPDAGILSAITIRMLQKLSLIYGFEYKTEEEVSELWLAAASAAGLDLGREFIEKQAMEKIVPRIIDRIAVRVGAEVAEKWSGRLIPLLSSGIGGTLNYYFVRSWGRRAQKHFLDRHRAVRDHGLPESKILNLPPQSRLSTAN